MPRAGLRHKLMVLDVPPWLDQAVRPWTIHGAQLWRDGAVRLELRSTRARVPVVLDLRGDRVEITLLDRRIDPERGGSLTRALSARFVALAELRPWLRALIELAQELDADGVDGAVARRDEPATDSELAAWLEVFRAWPSGQGRPQTQLGAPPELLSTLALPRAVRAALILHQLARGDVLGALEAGSALPDRSDPPDDDSPDGARSFAERQLELILDALLGRRPEALAAVAELERGCEDPDRWLVLARLYESLDAPTRAAAAHTQVVSRRGSVWDRLRRARVAGDFAEGETISRPEPGASERDTVGLLRELDKILSAAGRLDDWLAVLGPSLTALAQPPRDLVIRAATLHLWRGEGEQARAWSARLEGEDTGGIAALIEGALEILDGEPERGLAALDRAEAAGCDALERLTWKAEALVALDRLDEALVCVEAHVRAANTLVGYLLLLLIWARTMTAAALREAIQIGSFLDGLVPEVLPSLATPVELEAVELDPRAYAGLARRLLDAMGGNRSERPTWRRSDGQGGVSLEPVCLRATGREAAVDNLTRIRTEAPEAVLAGFEPLMHDYPDAPFACTYRGELLIWLGRYHDALASFAAADKRAKTRWSYVGRAAAYDLLGEAAKADHWGALGAEIFGELETATTHVYRGERLRKHGEWLAARADLDIALRAKPRRIGARINRALVYRALGNDSGWAADVAALERDAPAFLFLAGARRDQPVDPAMLLACLERMVGNRSSFLPSMIDDEGVFRIVPAPSRWVTHARLCLGPARDALARALVRRWLARVPAFSRSGS